MNSKKKLAVLGIAVLATFIFTITYAQPVISYNNSRLSVATPSIDYQVFQGNKTPFSKVFLETGSGAFFIFQTTGYQQQTIPSPLQRWYYKSNAAQQLVAQTAFYYDTIRRPPHASTNSIISENTPGLNPMQTLTGSNYITVTNAVGKNILPNDTMTIAISYKNTPSPSIDDASGYNQSVMAFFYNSYENDKLFKTIPTGSTPLYSFHGGNIKPVRMHNGESVISLGTLPSSIQQKLIDYKANYSDAVYFGVPYNPNGIEKNIFISLVPSSADDIIETNGGYYKAVLIDYGLPLPTVNTFEQDLITNAVSHDPNGINTTPHCLSVSSPPANKKIDYEIGFENDGTGSAKTIIIEASIPLGIQFPERKIKELKNIKGLRCKIGDSNVDVDWIGSPMTISEKGQRKCTYEFKPDSRKIIFRIVNAQLSHQPGPFGKNNIGSINFSLFTYLKENVKNMPDCMYSAVSIKFDDNKPVVPPPSRVKIDCKNAKDCLPVFIDPTKGK